MSCEDYEEKPVFRLRGFEVLANRPVGVLQATLPTRSTARSAGYDLYYAGHDMVLYPADERQTVCYMPTGIKAYMLCDEFLMITIRSSLGMKGISLANGVGIVDADYYNNPDNEGHIGILLVNNSQYRYPINHGDRIAQAIFVPYGLADNDLPASTSRTGGCGSTGR